MKIAVIGATGMIGHHTARAVLAGGHELVVIHRKSSNLTTLKDLKFSSAIADLDDRTALTRAFGEVDVVINCAGYYPTVPRHWQAEVETARQQMENFLSAGAQSKVNKLVYLSAAISLPKDPKGRPGTEALIYRDRPPDKTPYVQVKWEMDRMAREWAANGLPIVIAIPSMCFGEFDFGPSTGRLIVEIANRRMPGYIRGNRNVIYAGDAGTGLVLACEKGRVGERYLFTGSNVSMDELVTLIARIANVPPPARVVPLAIARVISKLQELRYRILGGELPQLSSTAIAVMASGQFLDGEKAATELNFRNSIDLTTTLERTVRWFIDQRYIPG